jgi:hypothetical protein
MLNSPIPGIGHMPILSGQFHFSCKIRQRPDQHLSAHQKPRLLIKTNSPTPQGNFVDVGMLIPIDWDWMY